MGALHEGHLALVDEARRRATYVVVSIFVNPLQFDNADDLDAYPRPIGDDVTACRDRGVDAVYAPTARQMYPDGFQTTVVPGGLADPMEGAMRPGHFAGVTTVVAKLFNIVHPDVAVFGEKDFQQLAIIRRMVTDLDVDTEVVAHPTVREADGLAMSSRNRRLSGRGRTAAGCVFASLQAGCRAAAAVSATTAQVRAAAAAVVAAEPRADADYHELFDADTLEPIDDLPGHRRAHRPARLAAAVWVDGVRLIDNVDLFGQPC
jgi:pantoate--beta-alanine ligase